MNYNIERIVFIFLSNATYTLKKSFRNIYMDITKIQRKMFKLSKIVITVKNNTCIYFYL